MEESPQGPGLPRWVKWSGVAAAVLLLAFVVLHLAGLSPGGHGP